MHYASNKTNMQANSFIRYMHPGPAQSFGELGHCLRLPSGRGPQNFRKDRVVGVKKKKKKVSNELEISGTFF